MQLNASSCRIITTVPIERPTYVNVHDNLMEVLTNDDFHKYLGRSISGDPKQRHHTEFKHGFQVVRCRFRKHQACVHRAEIVILGCGTVANHVLCA